ncbi:LysE family translocator [Heyndrickxia sp. NPDC080065]|uniref:LysE family translocator n=1 Tax=Heyndrickxia sp. NPDC080065 TaxID=3390568 RepID=UPI003CFEDD6B
MSNFFVFAFMSICLIILPGPDTAITTRNTLSLGRLGGIQTLLGTCCALCIHTLAVILGLSAIIVKSALLFSIIKYIGAIYLIYLGVKTLLSLRKDIDSETDKDLPTKGHHSCFRQGFLTNLLNPKVAVFFLTFLPQFLNPHANSMSQFLTMGITYTILTALWFVFYILLINRISVFMKKPKTQKFIQGITGAVLVGFAIKLAFEKPQ